MKPMLRVTELVYVGGRPYRVLLNRLQADRHVRALVWARKEAIRQTGTAGGDHRLMMQGRTVVFGLLDSEGCSEDELRMLAAEEVDARIMRETKAVKVVESRSRSKSEAEVNDYVRVKRVLAGSGAL